MDTASAGNGDPLPQGALSGKSTPMDDLGQAIAKL
jgi:hypothetical protein